MATSLQETLDDLIRRYYPTGPRNKADTKSKVIERILVSIGYDYDDIEREVVIPEKTIDFAILPFQRTSSGEEATWLVQAEDWNKALRDYAVQPALEYANNTGLRFALLTNGREWRIYDNKIQGQAQGKFVGKTEINDPNAVAFFSRLAKENVLDGQLPKFIEFENLKNKIRFALKDSTSGLTSEIVKAIQNELTDLIEVEDDLIRDAFLEVIHVPSSQNRAYVPELHPSTVVNEAPEPRRTKSVEMRGDVITKSLAEINPSEVTGKRVISIQIGEESRHIRYWYEVIGALIQRLDQLGKLPPVPWPSSSTYICSEEDKGRIRSLKSVTSSSGTKIYYEANLSSQGVIQISQWLCRASGFDLSQVIISYRGK